MAASYNNSTSNSNSNSFSGTLSSYVPTMSDIGPRSGDLQQQGLANQWRIAQRQAQAQELPAQLQQSRFETTWPYLTGTLTPWVMGQFGQTGGAGGGAGAQPQISAAPIWNDQQIQGQVNQMRSSNDASAQTATRKAGEQAAGRGQSSQSPLLTELGAANQGRAMMANTAGEQQTRWNAAQGNAQQVLSGQQAQEGQYAARQQEGIQRQRNLVSLQSALLGVLGGSA